MLTFHCLFSFPTFTLGFRHTCYPQPGLSGVLARGEFKSLIGSMHSLGCFIIPQTCIQFPNLEYLFRIAPLLKFIVLLSLLLPLLLWDNTFFIDLPLFWFLRGRKTNMYSTSHFKPKLQQS